MKHKMTLVVGATLLALVVFVNMPSAIRAQDQEPITPENANRLAQLVVLEQGTWVHSLAFSPDGTTLAVAAGSGWTEAGTLSLWDVSSRTQRAVLHENATWARSAVFSPDGMLLATGGGDGIVRLWNAATLEPVATLEGPSDRSALNITITDDSGVIHRPEAYTDAVWSLAFSPDGATLAVGRGDPIVGPGSLQLYDVATGEILANTRPAHPTDPSFSLSIFHLAFSPDGALLAVVDGQFKVRLWDAVTLEERTVLRRLPDWYMNHAAFNPDGTLLAAAGHWTDCSGWNTVCSSEDVEGRILVWEVETGEPFALIDGPGDYVQNVVFSPNGQILVSSSFNEVRLWHTVTWDDLAELEIQGASTLAFNPDGTLLATGGEDGTVRLWGVPAAST